MTLTDKILNNRITIVSFRSDWGTVKELSRIEVYGRQSELLIDLECEDENRYQNCDKPRAFARRLNQ